MEKHLPQIQSAPSTIKKFTYEGNVIEFDMKNDNVMVNATEMAKAFNKQVNEFTSNESTKSFIEVALKNGNSRFLNFKSEADLIYSKQKSGTWMHRVLALKFAAWLNPEFELWVYYTIDQLLFGEYRAIQESLKEQAGIRAQIQEVESRLQQTEDFKMLEALKLKDRQINTRRNRYNSTQLDLFMNLNTES